MNKKKRKAEAVKAVADKMGITGEGARVLIDKVDVGWTWSERPNDQGKGVIACAQCGITATVTDPQRIAPKCPGCGNVWKIAPVQ